MRRVVEMVNLSDDGGPHPTGYIVYDRTGRMAVQIMSDPRPTFRDADHPTAEDVNVSAKSL